MAIVTLIKHFCRYPPAIALLITKVRYLMLMQS